jgi:hypothetical protein
MSSKNIQRLSQQPPEIAPRRISIRRQFAKAVNKGVTSAQAAYRAVMERGRYADTGAPFEGRMVDISANHLALVFDVRRPGRRHRARAGANGHH